MGEAVAIVVEAPQAKPARLDTLVQPSRILIVCMLCGGRTNTGVKSIQVDHHHTTQAVSATAQRARRGISVVAH